MKSVLLFLVCFFLGVTVVYGETMYVKDVFEVMVRTGPDRTHKIIAMPKSGTPIEILEALDIEDESEWVKVRLPNEKEGWMLAQFLVPGPPKHEVITRLEGQNRALSLKAKSLAEENDRLRKERKELERALSKQTQTANSITESFETLKSESKEFMALKASYKKASKELGTKTKQVAELEHEVDGLRNSQTLRWFIAGGSVIIVGFIIGYASRRPKRRSSLL
jgi:SH3 domain protein